VHGTFQHTDESKKEMKSDENAMCMGCLGILCIVMFEMKLFMILQLL